MPARCNLSKSLLASYYYAAWIKRSGLKMPHPLRRLSLALSPGKSYKPYTTPDTSTLAQYLVLSKEKYLNDIRQVPSKAGEWTVVMGNEAGDLDSIASSIAFAWIQSEVHKKQTIPLIQTARDDFDLRAENIYALKLAGVDDPKQQLLSITDFDDIKPFPSHRFALVDHNHLGSSFTPDDPATRIEAVVDHHEDEQLYKDTADPRVIAPSGSCASHVASLCPPDLPHELATLLLCAILIDTGGLKPAGKALQLDRDAAGFLVTRSTLASSIPPKLLSALSDDPNVKDDSLYDAEAIKDLTKDLSTRKSDLSHLSGWDLLRRDYKEYAYTLAWTHDTPTIKAGLSTVPVALKTWATKGRLQKEGVAWMEHRGLTILGVLTSFRGGKGGKGKHKREMAWIILEGTALSKDFDYDLLASRLWTGLKDDQEIKVQRHKKFIFKVAHPSQKLKARVYKQGNADATRKVVAPLLKSILESSEPSPPKSNDHKEKK